MKILVTGVAGFVGLNFTNFALEQGASVVGYDINDAFGRLEQSGLMQHRNFSFVASDLSVDDLSIDSSTTHLLHLAALAHVDYSRRHPELVIANNVNSTLAVLKALRDAPRPAFVTSSVEVYGGSQGHVYEVTDARMPLSSYALSKVCCEDMCAFYRDRYQIPLTVVRLTNLFGPWQSPDRVIPRSIARHLHGLPLFADEGRTRDFLHVRDIIRAIWTGLNGGKSFGTLNLSSGFPLPIREVVQKIAGSSPINLLPDSDPRNRGPDLTSSPALASKELNWQPEGSFDQKLEDTFRWYAANRNWLAQFEGQIFGENADSFLVDDKRFRRG